MFFDTSSGLQYSSINAIVSADIVLVVTSTDKSNVERTQRMIHDRCKLFEKKTGIVINKAKSESVSKIHGGRSIKLEMYNSLVVGIIPCLSRT